jgi:hypothetical protein
MPQIPQVKNLYNIPQERSPSWEDLAICWLEWLGDGSLTPNLLESTIKSGTLSEVCF